MQSGNFVDCRFILRKTLGILPWGFFLPWCRRTIMKFVAILQCYVKFNWNLVQSSQWYVIWMIFQIDMSGFWLCGYFIILLNICWNKIMMKIRVFSDLLMNYAWLFFNSDIKNYSIDCECRCMRYIWIFFINISHNQILAFHIFLRSSFFY